MSDRIKQVLRLTHKSRVRKSRASRSKTRARRLLKRATNEDQEQVAAHEAELEQHEDDAPTDPNHDAWLIAFPFEIVQQITSYIPLESVVCLTLTCKLALRVLGNASWTDRRIRRCWSGGLIIKLEPLRKFLQLLVRDFEGWTDCQTCETLHPPVKRPSEWSPTKITQHCFGRNAVIDNLPMGKDGFRYRLVPAHITEAMARTPRTLTTPIESLSNSLQVPHEYLNYTISSSASRVYGKLILRHDYKFSCLPSEGSLDADDILDLPFRICPHQSTSRDRPPGPQNSPRGRLNSFFLTHTIDSAFPVSKRAVSPETGLFREPSRGEKKQMATAHKGKNVFFKCRLCPTQWRVSYASGERGKGELTVSAYHYFSSEPRFVERFWSRFVRREGVSLNDGNSEFSHDPKTYPNTFRAEHRHSPRRSARLKLP